MRSLYHHFALWPARFSAHRPARCAAVGLVAVAALALTAPLMAQQYSVRDKLPSIVVVGAINSQRSLVGSGSGTIVSPTGTIITNFHVLGDTDTGRLIHPEGLAAIFMTSRSDQPARFVAVAQIVEADPDTDLAVLQIIADPSFTRINPAGLNLASIPLGDSDQVEVGDRIMILGFPDSGNKENAANINSHFFVTLTDGMVSGFDREGAVRSWIRTTAPIMMGNSGGAVLDNNGCLVGVPTLSISKQLNLEKMAYLRPINHIPTTWLAGTAARYCRSTGATAPGEPAAPVRSAGVTFSGKIVDANTGRGIPGATFALLKPGSNQDSPRTEDYVAFARADQAGNFQTVTPVPRGIIYPAMVHALGYRPLKIRFEVRNDFTDHTLFDPDIRLQR